MPQYLGETPIDIPSDPVLSKLSPADWAMYYIGNYGGIDGGHHKAWVLDQVARILKGTPITARLARWDNEKSEVRVSTGEPSSAYLAWVEEQLGETEEDGSREYSYDLGIPP